MTALASRPATTRPSTVQAQPVSVGRSVASEWIKFRTLRSSWAVLGGAVVAMIVIALLIGNNTRVLTPRQQPDDLVTSSTLQGYYLAQLLLGALGVLFVTGEYSTGMIRSTLVAVPRRLPVLVSKMIVFTSVVLPVMLVTSTLAFLAAQAVIGSHRTGYSLGDPGALRVVLGTGLYLTLLGLLGGALGWVLRSTPGGLVAYFAVVVVLPVLLAQAFGTTGQKLSAYFPSSAGGSFIRSLPEPHSLSAGPGLAVLVGWVAVASVVAALRLRSRDA